MISNQPAGIRGRVRPLGFGEALVSGELLTKGNGVAQGHQRASGGVRAKPDSKGAPDTLGRRIRYEYMYIVYAIVSQSEDDLDWGYVEDYFASVLGESFAGSVLKRRQRWE